MTTNSELKLVFDEPVQRKQAPKHLADLAPADRKAWAKELGFQPEIYSPYFVALTKDVVSDLKRKGMKVIPWTVNTAEQMQNLLDMGVDGIITDFPNLAPKK